MRKTQTKSLFPMIKGLDKTSIPGTQDPRSLSRAKNIFVRNRGSLKKAPGIERIPYIGNNSGNLQGAVHFFATSGGAQRSEIIRVIGGRIEALRNGIFVDLGFQAHPTDVVVFERFANALIIHFENSPPQHYTIGGTPTDLTLLTGHSTSPPTFSRKYDFRLWYGGRPASPHVLTVSAINSLNDYSLTNGGFSMRVEEGDGDPVGLTGLAPPFRGDLFSYKWEGIYRIYRTQYGYGIDTVTTEVGCVHHNTIVGTQNDIFSVSNGAINSLANTQKYGSVEEATISYPIYEYFQENVNWSASKNMIAVYDKPSNCYLLSYASVGSSQNDRVLGFNIKSGEFFEMEDVEYPVLAKYYDLGRKKTMVGDNTMGLGVLQETFTTAFDQPIPVEISTGIVFPLESPKALVNFTKVWVYAKPTLDSVEFTLKYWINGDLIGTHSMDTEGEGRTFEGVEGGMIGTSVIGNSLIGSNKEDFIILEATLRGEGHSIQFDLVHEPAEDDPDQKFEIYGIEFEFDYEETTDQSVKI